jgi:predicted cation transporter
MLGIIAAVVIVLWLLGFFAFHVTTYPDSTAYLITLFIVVHCFLLVIIHGFSSSVASPEFTASRFPLTSRNPAISAKLALKTVSPPRSSLIACDDYSTVAFLVTTQKD